MISFELKMRIISKIILFLLVCNISFAQDRDVQSKIKYYTEKAQNYLDKEKALSGFYSIDKDGIKMYASTKDKLANKAEFSINWNQLPEYSNSFKQCNYFSPLEIYKTGKCDSPIPCLAIGGEHVFNISIPNALKPFTRVENVFAPSASNFSFKIFAVE